MEDNIAQNSNSSQNLTSRSYSNAVTSFKFPSKDQAIVLTALENVKIHDYLIAIGGIIQPKNIIFASRIANNRICIYLSSTSLVEKLVNTQKFITINGTNINIRRLLTPSQRLVFSNVCPSVPNEVIDEQLSLLGLTPISPITLLRVGMPEADYGHILSFRRQVYISPIQSNKSIPDSIIISHDNIPYRIYLTIDGLNCANCRSVGHAESDCPKVNPLPPPQPINSSQMIDTILSLPNTTTTPVSSSEGTPKNSNTSPLTSNTPAEYNKVQQITTEALIHQPPPTIQSDMISFPPLPSKQSTSNATNILPMETDNSKLPTKRQLSTSPEICTDNPRQVDFQKPKPPKIPKAKRTRTDIGQILEPLKNIMNTKAPPYILNYTETCDFLVNALNSKHPDSIARNYITDTAKLKEMLTAIHKNIEDRILKGKITRLQKKLDIYSDTSTCEDSDSSQQAQENDEQKNVHSTMES